MKSSEILKEFEDKCDRCGFVTTFLVIEVNQYDKEERLCFGCSALGQSLPQADG